MTKLMFSFAVSLSSIFALLAFSPYSEACLEKPKSLKLSETTFENSAEVSYGVNCRVSITVKTDADVSYFLGQGYGEDKVDKLCLTIQKGRDYENKKEYCGEELERLSMKDKNALALRDKNGDAIGALEIKGKNIRLLSWSGGGNAAKPHLEFQIEDLAKSWKVRAMQNEATQVGGGALESAACTRSIGGKDSGKALDLRGKQISTAGAGCTAGVIEAEYGGAAGSAPRRPTFQMEGTSR
jgi:hypothetical protein